jgi:hypothetical protein
MRACVRLYIFGRIISKIRGNIPKHGIHVFFRARLLVHTMRASCGYVYVRACTARTRVLAHRRILSKFGGDMCPFAHLCTDSLQIGGHIPILKCHAFILVRRSRAHAMFTKGDFGCRVVIITVWNYNDSGGGGLTHGIAICKVVYVYSYPITMYVVI